MELMKENIDTNAEIIARLKQELMDVNRQVEEQCQKKGKLESDIASIKAKSAVESKNSKLIEELNVKRSEARGLKEGVELLSGVADPTASRLENGDLRMSFKIEGFVFDITTDKTTKCVTDIRNVSGDFQHDLTKVLQSCAAIPAQQDLRFAIHSIKSMIHSAIILKKHIADLRKFCIVKQSNDTVFLTMRNGLTAEIVTNESYSQSPASACLTSLVGVGGWSAEDLERMRVSVNNTCYSDIRDIYSCLQGLS